MKPFILTGFVKMGNHYMETPLLNKKYILEKYPGKGGWTYAVISEIPTNKRARFGWIKVKGTIDSYEIKGYKLMRLSNGKLFLPVKAEIRKAIGKKAGDHVKVVLYADNDPVEIPQELLVCLLEDPAIHHTFLNYSEVEQKAFIDWISTAKTDKTKVDRIAKTLDKLARRQKFADK